MTQKAIGPSFYDEIVAAGLAGLPFAWSAEGAITFDPSMTSAQVTAVENVYAAHDPTKLSWHAYQQQALSLLSDSDITLLRCVENSVPIPAAWTAYRKALRAILGATSGDPTQPLPTKPPYPAGT